MIKQFLSLPFLLLLTVSSVSAEQSVYSELKGLRESVIQHEKNLISMSPNLSESDERQADRVVAETNHLLCWLSYWTDMEFLIDKNALSPEDHYVSDLFSERRETFGKFLHETEGRMNELVANFSSGGAALEAAKIRDAIGDALTLLSALGSRHGTQRSPSG
jgi:hypothetical protein